MRRSFGPDSSTKTTRRVEIALLAGQPLVDRIRNDVRDAPPVVRRGEVLLAGLLLAGEHVPQTELGLEPPVALPGDAAGHQRLGVDGAPVGEARHRVDVDDLFDEGGRIDRREQPAALEVGGDDLGDVARHLDVALRPADEIRHRDRHRLDIALRDVDAQNRERRAARRHQRGGTGAERQQAAA